MKQKQPKAKKKFQSESMDTTDPRSLNFEKHKRERERELVDGMGRGNNEIRLE
jgi:hypothetical protein